MMQQGLTLAGSDEAKKLGIFDETLLTRLLYSSSQLSGRKLISNADDSSSQQYKKFLLIENINLYKPNSQQVLI